MVEEVLNAQPICFASWDVPLCRITGTYTRLFFIAGRSVGIIMHWEPVLGRTMPCLHTGCGCCGRSLPARPLSYLPAIRLDGASGCVRWRRVVLEVPHRAGLALLERVGEVVPLARSKRCGPLVIGVYNGTELPAERGAFDVFPTLRALWRISPTTQVRLTSSMYNDL